MTLHLVGIDDVARLTDVTRLVHSRLMDLSCLMHLSRLMDLSSLVDLSRLMDLSGLMDLSRLMDLTGFIGGHSHVAVCRCMSESSAQEPCRQHGGRGH